MLSAAATGLYIAHGKDLGPIQPYWSWLFDYCDPLVVHQPGQSTRFVGVWAADESTPWGRKADEPVEIAIDWPPNPADFADLAPLTPPPQPILRHRRAPRQGLYDNIHITAPMGDDALGRAIVSAPVCADMCFHLHWRWGPDGLRGPRMVVPNPQGYFGWSHTGRVRSHAVPGGPLIPPNQHLEVEVSRVSDGRVDVFYTVEARLPRDGHWQVLLEQGSAFAYNYQGLAKIAWQALTTVMLDSVLPDTPKNRRESFMKIYARLRWFDPSADGAATATIQQIPSWADLDIAKQNELAEQP